jgi:2-haloacid dehalogenase
MYGVRVVVLDVNETLSDLTGLAQRFVDVGLPSHSWKPWFNGVLRDGFALTVTGQSANFKELADSGLRAVMSDASLAMTPDAAVHHILSSFGKLPLHADVAQGLRDLHDAGLRVVTLTNGSVEVTESLLSTAGVLDHVDVMLAANDAGHWKPHPASYAYAAETLGVAPQEMIMVAVHPWDIHGASQAGLRTAWVNRDDVPYPNCFDGPDISPQDLIDLARQLSG